VAGSLSAGLALALAACGGVAIQSPPTAEPAPAATAEPRPTLAAAAQPAIERPTTAPIARPTNASSPAEVSSAQPWAPVDPCALHDHTTVEALYGALVTDPVVADTVANSGLACAYDATKVTLRVEVYNGSRTPVSALLSDLEQAGLTMKPEFTTGDEAYSGKTDERAALLVTQDGTLILFDLTNKTDDITRAATLLNGLAATALVSLPVPSLTSEEPRESSASPASPATAKGEGPCALLTVAEVEAALGGLEGAPDDSGQDGDGNPSCIYVARDGMLFLSSSAGGAAAVKAQIARAQESGAPLEAIAGLGDEAYTAVASMPDVPSGDVFQGVLLVRKGEMVLQIAGMVALSEAETAAVLQQLAERALARLP